MEIYLTLDYELFMGNKVGTVDNSLIKPTKELVNVLNKYDVKATFFVDAAYLYRLNEFRNSYIKLEKDYSLVVEQIKNLSQSGHDIQLHIHPQWYYAEYNGTDWKLPNSPYKLSDMEENEATECFVKSKRLLEKIIEKPVIAFRAGGYSIQTFASIPRLFSESGIIIDSSVLSGIKNLSDYQEYDYSMISSGSLYNFRDSVISINEEGPFVEVPITTGLSYSFGKLIEYLKTRFIKSGIDVKYGDGDPITSLNKKKIKSNLISRILLFWAYLNQSCVASIDSGRSNQLLRLYKKKKNNQVFVIIGHPKNLSPKSLQDIDYFINNTISNCIFKRIHSVNSVSKRPKV